MRCNECDLKRFYLLQGWRDSSSVITFDHFKSLKQLLAAAVMCRLNVAWSKPRNNLQAIRDRQPCGGRLSTRTHTSPLQIILPPAKRRADHQTAPAASMQTGISLFPYIGDGKDQNIYQQLSQPQPCHTGQRHRNPSISAAADGLTGIRFGGEITEKLGHPFLGGNRLTVDTHASLIAQACTNEVATEVQQTMRLACVCLSLRLTHMSPTWPSFSS